MSTPTNIANFDGQKPVIDDDAVKGAEEALRRRRRNSPTSNRVTTMGRLAAPDFP